MNYIMKQIDRKIAVLERSDDKSALNVYYQVRIEFSLFFILGYLWNKNLTRLEPDEREYVFGRIFRPSIGDIEDVGRKLDIDREIFGNGKISTALKKYPRIRNERIGHGYTFEDGSPEYAKSLVELYESIVSSSSEILGADCDLVTVDRQDGEYYKGLLYRPDGADYSVWSCPAGAHNFGPNETFLLTSKNEYWRLSPFVEIIDHSEYYVYSSVSEPLNGTIKYNRIMKTGNKTRDWLEFCGLDIENDGTKRKSKNGTILNVVAENRNPKYIEVGIKKKILSFLLETNHSVSATIWGHGGVGKTAVVKQICEELANQTMKKYDYIIFLSAKDIVYNYITGRIDPLSENIQSFEEVIKTVNRIIFGIDSNKYQAIKDYTGRLLLIIDDYETFRSDEKEKIRSFIRELNPQAHRVLVTTRANLIIGDEIPVNELSADETANFLIKVAENETAGNVNVEQLINQLKDAQTRKKIHEITSGRPLFIFQFAFLILQRGELTAAIRQNINQSTDAIQFLYGRIFDYITRAAQDIFVCMGMLVTKDDLSNLLEKVRYILGYDSESEAFSVAVRELEKLKIVEISEENFFTVYSREILQIMTDYLQKKDSDFRSRCNQRLLQISKDKKLDVEASLLQSANKSRYSKNEEEVASSYRQIINRTTATQDIRLEAVINLVSYYYLDRGKQDVALKTMGEFYHLFSNSGDYVRLYANYCWASASNSEKEKAIKILLEYLQNNGNLARNPNLELLALLLTYRGIFTIRKKDLIKEKLSYNEIDYSTFSRLNTDLKVEFNDIATHQGNKLFSHLVRLNMNNVTAAARQNCITGLNQYSEICIRLLNYELAIRICEFVIDKFPYSVHSLFSDKIRKIRSFMN